MTDNTITPTTYLTVAEVAKDLRLSPMTVYRLIDRGDIPAITVGTRTRRIPTAAYRDYKRRLHQTAAARTHPVIPGQTEITA